MGLTAEEAKQLKALQDKAKDTDKSSIGRSINVSIDMGDEKQVKRAQKLGLLGMFDDDDDDDKDDDKKDKDEDDTPKRRGYFDK